MTIQESPSNGTFAFSISVRTLSRIRNGAIELATTMSPLAHRRGFAATDISRSPARGPAVIAVNFFGVIVCAGNVPLTRRGRPNSAKCGISDHCFDSFRVSTQFQSLTLRCSLESDSVRATVEKGDRLAVALFPNIAQPDRARDAQTNRLAHQAERRATDRRMRRQPSPTDNVQVKLPTAVRLGFGRRTYLIVQARLTAATLEAGPTPPAESVTNGDSKWRRNIDRKAGCTYDAQGSRSSVVIGRSRAP